MRTQATFHPVLGSEYAEKLRQMTYAAQFELALKQRLQQEQPRKYKHSRSVHCTLVRRGK